jgi:N,N-dimethylformamidase
MLDALQAYRDAGGRLVYLGGNGFYWKIALDPVREGIIEVRRAEGGIRAWAAEPGEYYQQFDGQYGGLWRRNARPPQKLVGVGFTAQGNFVGSHYRVNPAARQDPRVSWILEGVSAETVGGEGFSGHGAAGFELDRVDHRLGLTGGRGGDRLLREPSTRGPLGARPRRAADPHHDDPGPPSQGADPGRHDLVRLPRGR